MLLLSGNVAIIQAAISDVIFYVKKWTEAYLLKTLYSKQLSRTATWFNNSSILFLLQMLDISSKEANQPTQQGIQPAAVD